VQALFCGFVPTHHRGLRWDEDVAETLELVLSRGTFQVPLLLEFNNHFRSGSHCGAKG
jgi:hypothetical protein